MRFFLFRHKKELWIVNDPNKVPKPRELLLQNGKIEILRDKAEVLESFLTGWKAPEVKKKKSPKKSLETL